LISGDITYDFLKGFFVHIRAKATRSLYELRVLIWLNLLRALAAFWHCA
jgi:hypothetical protein